MKIFVDVTLGLEDGEELSLGVYPIKPPTLLMPWTLGWEYKWIVVGCKQCYSNNGKHEAMFIRAASHSRHSS